MIEILKVKTLNIKALVAYRKISCIVVRFFRLYNDSPITKGFDGLNKLVYNYYRLVCLGGRHEISRSL
jgi:hypothetical protein